MTEEQLKNFIYSCQTLANNARFDEQRYIVNFLGDKTVDEQPFCDVIMKNQRIVENMHFGVCFTYTCWACHLLWTMGIESGYYILETIEKGTGCVNYVLLFEHNGEYKICDLAAQVIHQEKVHRALLTAAQFPDSYGVQKTENLVKALADSTLINQSLEKYFKFYTGGVIFAADGISDERCFTEIPRIALRDFLDQKKFEVTFKI